MTDASTPETPSSVEPAAAAAPPAPAAEPAAVVPAEPAKKKRGVGIWAFILGLLTVIADIVLIVVAVSTLLGLVADLSSGDFSGVPAAIAAAGLGFLFIVVLFGGLVLAGLGALLGLIALFSGRGRLIGFFGLLLAAIALTWRILLLTAGLNVGNLFGS